jgi:hypothetical protein
MILATKTLNAISDAIHSDNGAKFRTWLGRVIPHMSDAYRPDSDELRTHLGASQIGKECARSLWYSFRWVGEDDFRPSDGETSEQTHARMLRLWNRGHIEEARFIAMLLTIGVRVIQQDANGAQLRFRDCAGHFAGSMDGILKNVPDMPDVDMLGEFKTYNEKRFVTLVANGVEMSDEEYFIQTQIYMAKFNLKYTLFLAVCKNDDKLHAEIIEFRPEVFARFKDRASQIIYADAPPRKINNASPGYYKCKFCNFTKACHLGREIARNCRTCVFVKPSTSIDSDGNPQWECRKTRSYLNKSAQLAGCSAYHKITEL